MLLTMSLVTSPASRNRDAAPALFGLVTLPPPPPPLLPTLFPQCLSAASDHEGRKLSDGVDEEAAGGVPVQSELYAAVRAASEGLGRQSVAKDLGIECRLTLHLDASAAEDWARRNTPTCSTCGYRRHPSQECSSRRKSVRTCEPRRLDDRATTRTEGRGSNS